MIGSTNQTYTTTSRHGDLNSVAADLTDIFEVKWFMCRFIFSTIDVQWSGVDRHLDASRPISIHGSVFVVEAFELQL